MSHSEFLLRAILTFLTNALAIATAGSCLAVIIKRDQDIAHAKESGARAGITVSISTKVLDGPGEALAAACIFTGLVTFVYAVVQPFILYRRSNPRSLKATHSFIPWLWWITLPVATLFLLGSSIATWIVAKNKEASVTARLGTTVLPDALVKSRAAALGINTVFWSKSYVRQMAYLAWPTLALTFLLTCFTAYTAMKHRKAARSSRVAYDEPQMATTVMSRDSMIKA